MTPNACMSWEAIVFDSSCLSSRSETMNKGQPSTTMKTETDSRSGFDPLLSNASRCPVADAIQMRSLDGTVQKKSLAEQIDPQEKQMGKMPVIEGHRNRRLVGRCGRVIQGIHSLLDSKPAWDFRNSWKRGVSWAFLGTHTEAMRYSSRDSAVDLWAEVVRDEHICKRTVHSRVSARASPVGSEGTDHVKSIGESVH